MKFDLNYQAAEYLRSIKPTKREQIACRRAVESPDAVIIHARFCHVGKHCCGVRYLTSRIPTRLLRVKNISRFLGGESRAESCQLWR